MLRLARVLSLVPKVTAVAVALIVPPALAQFGGDAGLANAFRQDFYRRDLTIFNQVLQLEDWQRPIIEVLLDDYAASFETGLAGMRESIGKLRGEVAGDDGRQIMERMMVPLEAWEREKVVLRDQFLADVQTQLSPAQIDRWPALERALRREKDLPQGELSGESLDLVAVLRQAQIPTSMIEEIAPVVQEYEIALDQALVTREARISSLQPLVRQAMTAMDFDRGLQVMQQIMAARIEVRTVQEAGLASITAALPPDLAPRFRDEALEQAFPKVYGPNATIAFIDAAKQLEDLSPEQREGIETIERDYLSQLAGMNDRLRDLYRTEEPNEPRRRFERVMRRQRGEAPSREAVGEPESIRDLRGERENVGRLAREAILALLTPDQVSRLPGFSKPEGEPAKDAFGGFQQTPQSNDAQGLGSDSTMTDEERRRQALSPKDRSPPPAIGGRGSKQADSERIRSDSPRGRGSRPDSGQSPPPLQAE